MRLYRTKTYIDFEFARLEIPVECLPLLQPDTVVRYPPLLEVGVDDTHLKAVLFGEQGGLYRENKGVDIL